MGDSEIKSYRDLRVWQRAMDLAVLCYTVSRLLPKDELYGLVSQMRRSSSSIAANIAEGHGREHSGSFVQFLRIAQGSLKETETHLLLSERLGFLDRSDLDQALSLAGEVGRMLRSLIRSIQANG